MKDCTMELNPFFVFTGLLFSPAVTLIAILLYLGHWVLAVFAFFMIIAHEESK